MPSHTPKERRKRKTKKNFPKGTSGKFKTKVSSNGFERTITFGKRRKKK